MSNVVNELTVNPTSSSCIFPPQSVTQTYISVETKAYVNTSNILMHLFSIFITFETDRSNIVTVIIYIEARKLTYHICQHG